MDECFEIDIMKRILHIVGKMDRAGAESMLMNLYRAIDRTEIQFDFVVFTKDKGDFDDEIKALGGKIIPILSSNPLERMKELKEFLLKHKEYQIVHAHTLFSIGLHLRAAQQAGVKYRIAHSHNTSDVKQGTLVGEIYHRIARMLIKKHATHYIGCGDAASKFLFPWKKDVLILPNSIDVNQWNTIGKNNKDYISKAFQYQGLKIIQVGRLQPVKNHEFSLNLAAYMQSKNIDFKLFIVGQGELKDEIQRKIKENKLENSVELLGLRTDIAELMAGADVMLMPSLHEGFPVVLVESQAVGLRAVIADTISSEVDLRIGLVDFLSLEDDLEKWTQKIVEKPTQSMNDQQRVEKLTIQGYDINNNALQLSDLYKQMN